MRRVLGALATAAALTLAGCSNHHSGTVRLTVLAAQSLAPGWNDVAAQVHRHFPDVTLDTSFAGTSTLVEQVKNGAPADLFVSADRPNMDKLVTAKLAGPPAVIARNRLVIVVPRANPKHIASLADLSATGVRVALCAPGVPCGTYARQAFAKAGVPVPAASAETSVSGVVTKVAAGEADGGIAYVTDVNAAVDKVSGVGIPDGQNVLADYPAAVLRSTKNAGRAGSVLAYLKSPAVTAILQRFGFLAP